MGYDVYRPLKSDQRSIQALLFITQQRTLTFSSLAGYVDLMALLGILSGRMCYSLVENVAQEAPSTE